ncbi:hypothetical protein TWF106_011370 [Orbilia oligospora]|uniref:25S rRNA (Uridine(2843)-N(3))-methyltransferase n=1 Tax=Orbilia oligospora TaxID=2813651 RepID=A0A7C8QCV6_ORBOL|nr:hypothetical protein TWF191_001864 [Orbilia oligospora]KAF3208687.1 hypothetical protein TWF106_011370 [Orbilia oligospora]
MPQSKRPPASLSKAKQSSKPDKIKLKRNTSTAQNNNTNNTNSTNNNNTNTARNSKSYTTTNPLVLSQFKPILNTFQHTFSHLFTPELPQIIQSVKQSLYLRDYVAAFDSPEKLQAYAVRWSVARALAYFEMISGHWWSEDVTQIFSTSRRLRVTCVGGGAGAEIVGITAAYSFLSSSSPSPSSSIGVEGEDVDTGLDLTFLDFATWAPITDSLFTTITDPTKESNVFLDKTKISAKCYQQDVLTPLSDTTVSSMASADIVTILFTAGELYSQSPTATTKFFMSLHTITKPGALLVVVDSAGGFEDLDVLKKNQQGNSAAGGESGKIQSDGNIGGYKLGFLLDKTLTNREQWQTIVSQDTKWWRVPQELKDTGGYPLELENMRCLIRVYRRNDDP